MASLTRITPTGRSMRTRKHLVLLPGGDAASSASSSSSSSSSQSCAPSRRAPRGADPAASQGGPDQASPRRRPAAPHAAPTPPPARDGEGAGARGSCDADRDAVAPAAPRRAAAPTGDDRAVRRRRPAARPAAGRPGASRPAPRRRPATPVADAGPVRLTRRGKVVVGIGVAGLMAGSFWLGTMSGEREETTPRQDAWVVVQSGDTLWTIATRARPDADPHTTVQRIIEANRLGGAAVRPGQALRIPGG